MNTKIITIAGEEPFTQEQEMALAEAGEILKKGGLVAFPTETVYGLGGDALNKDSSHKIYEAKGRPSDNPLIVHISRISDMERIAHVSEEALKVAEAFWPGPLTIILPKKENVPTETTGGLNTVAIRMPSHPVAAKLIEYGGGYVAAPSANVSGRPSPTLAKYVIEDMQGKIEAIIDGGAVGIGLESTIIDLTSAPPQILRPGYITEEMLGEVLGEVDRDVTIMRDDSGQAPKAPGMKYRHYAPKGKLTIVSGKEGAVVRFVNSQAMSDKRAGERVGVIATDETGALYDTSAVSVIKSVGSRNDEECIARNLYAILREFDDEQITRIYSEGFCAEGFGQAIMNRLLKAAGHEVIEV